MLGLPAAIVALIKALPAIRSIYLQTVDLYFSAQETRDQNQMSEIDEERGAIMSALKQPGVTDAQKRIFRKRLIDLSKL